MKIFNTVLNLNLSRPRGQHILTFKEFDWLQTDTDVLFNLFKFTQSAKFNLASSMIPNVFKSTKRDI